MRNRPLLSFAVLLSAIAVAGCDGMIRIRGRVVDAAGTSIATAKIHLEPTRNGHRFEDDVSPDGCFRVGRVVAPGRYAYKVLVTAEGFKPAQGVVRTLEDNRAIIVLRAVTDSAPSSFEKTVGKWPNDVAIGCDSNRNSP
jgi:hypothetical protein